MLLNYYRMSAHIHLQTTHISGPFDPRLRLATSKKLSGQGLVLISFCSFTTVCPNCSRDHGGPAVGRWRILVSRSRAKHGAIPDGC